MDTPSLTSATDAEFVAEGLKRGFFTRTTMILVGNVYDFEVNRLLARGARLIGPRDRCGKKSDTLLRGSEVFVLTYEEPEDPHESIGYVR